MVYPLEANIDWISGKDNMTQYKFGQERVVHSFCGKSSNGPSTFATRDPYYSRAPTDVHCSKSFMKHATPSSSMSWLANIQLTFPRKKKICGTAIGGKSADPNFFADNRAVNVRTLKDIDIDKLKLRKVDGRNRP